ncbi:unnamed protein product, partial [Rotaria magnacalcarata]
IPSFVANSNGTASNYPQFVSHSNGKYTAELHLTTVEPSVEDEQILSYILPVSLKPVMSAVEKDASVGAYFAISCALPTPNQLRTDQLDIPSKRICILW